MSIESVAIALHHSRAKGTAALVLIGIANHDGDGGAWPSVETLAKYGRCTPRSVQRAIAELEQLGEVRRDVQAGGTADMRADLRPNRYHFLLRCPAGCDRTPAHRVRPVDNSASNGVTPASPGDTGVTPRGDTGVTQTIPRTGHIDAHSAAPHVTTSAGAVDKCHECDDVVDREHPAALALALCPRCYSSPRIRRAHGAIA